MNFLVSEYSKDMVFIYVYVVFEISSVVLFIM